MNKKYFLIPFLVTILFFSNISTVFSQSILRLGDLPKSDYTISIYQVVGFQEGAEGYKITYLDTNNELKYFYLPSEMRDKYTIYKPKENTLNQNFIVIWRKKDSVERVEWFMPQKIDYNLPFFSTTTFNEEDKKIFKQITEKGELSLKPEAIGGVPLIKPPGE